MSTPPSPTTASTARATAILAVPAPAPPSDPPPTQARKFPAPCWTHDETLALISSYQDKWYSLRRRNLRTADWDAVALEVTRRCPGHSPPKSSAQCRHKMEKLRKRYRTEKLRLSNLHINHTNFNHHHHPHLNNINNNNNNNGRFFGSSWVLFDLIHSMELGSGNDGGPINSNGNDVVVANVDLDVKPFSMNNTHNVNGNGKKVDLGNYFDEIMLGSSNNNNNNKGRIQNHEFEVRGSGGSHTKFKVKNHNHFGGGGGGGGGFEDEYEHGNEYGGGVKRKGEGYGMMLGNRTSKEGEGGTGTGTGTGVGEMVESIRMLGEGLVKMEKMKIEMMRDIEKMRMEMEMKRSEMILESQHLIVNAFIDGLKKSKKVKLTDTV